MKAEDRGAQCSICPLRDDGMADTQWPTTIREDGKRVAVVGEAPGFNETVYGKPFTGPSGRLLGTVLSHYGFRRSEVMLTNVCLCRPPNNATPPRAAINACAPRLARDIQDLGATDIIALGGTAGTLLVDDPGTITRLRIGPPKQLAAWARQEGNSKESSVRVIPTWHPAYCLRSADAFPALVSDIGKIKEASREPWSPPQWQTADDVTDALEAIRQLSATEGPLVIDIEVGFDKDEAFDHPNNYSLLCVGIGYARGRAVVLGEGALTDSSAVDGLRTLLTTTPSGARRRIIAHNGKFDLAGLYPRLGTLELWFDTMLASYCLDERPGNHGLKVLAVERLGAPKYDEEIRRYVPRRGNYADIPRPILYKYNAYDVACTWDLYEMFEASLGRADLRKVHDFLVRASNQLMFLELNGIAIDREAMRNLAIQYQHRLEEIEAKIDEIIRTSTTDTQGINPRSPKQVKEYLATQKITVASTNEETLKVILDKVNPQSATAHFAQAMLLYRRQHKLYSTYIEGIRKRMYRGRIYTTYLLHGSTSGRLASRNPNLQNIVRDAEIRRQFGVSKPENVLVQCDYANAEARVMAHLAQDEYLRQILSDQTPGYKFFNELSDQLYGVGKWGKEEYIRTKAFFYGIAYGRETYSIAMEFGLPMTVADRQYREFLGLFPQVMEWQASVKERVLKGGSLVTPFGRKRRFWLITDQNRKDVLNEALSYLPQSTASDICLSAFIRLRPMLRGLGYFRLTIHDALVAECSEANTDKVAELLSTVMAEEGRKFSDYVPWPVDVSVGKSWGDL